MKTPVQNFINKTMGSRKSQDRVLALIDSGIADKLMEEREAERLAQRATLVEKLKAPQKTLAAEAAKIGEHVAKSKQHYEDSIKLVTKAHEQYGEAMGRSLMFGYTHQTAIADAQLLLLQSSDPRLAQFLNTLENLRDRLRGKVEMWTTMKPTFAGRVKEHHSNVEEMNQASNVIVGCAERCKNMQMQAISAKDVTACLTNMCTELEIVLMPLDVRTPSVKDGEVVED